MVHNYNYAYTPPAQNNKQNNRKIAIGIGIVATLILIVLGYFLFFAKKTPQQAADKLDFSSGISAAEQALIKKSILEQSLTYSGNVEAKITTSLSTEKAAHAVGVYVPVTHKYAVRQNVKSTELASLDIYTAKDTDTVILQAINELTKSETKTLNGNIAEIDQEAVAFIPVEQLSPEVKLLSIDDNYYLEAFDKGAIFRTVAFEGFNASGLQEIAFERATKDSTFSFMQTGVTALTRVMMKKLQQVKDPLYFSKNIADFMSAADITHVSNEVSFQSNCQYHAALFCSPPEFIETLKASGVDVVELTGNHNNDVGREYNTQTIEQYRKLGWGTVGGGLNSSDATKPYSMDKKGSKVTLLAYNYPDSPYGLAIATESQAGANSFDFDKIAADITAAKQAGAQSVIVDVQFWECYAYPDGYVEYPICDKPIPNQKEVFRKIADLGADLVVGTSAHQPQTYEFYNGTAIYYGLGNLYFEQTSWPGTERGLILTHYYHQGKLMQTRITPTVYGKELQVRLMNEKESTYLLERLQSAR